jgi:hypothetical protein
VNGIPNLAIMVDARRAIDDDGLADPGLGIHDSSGSKEASNPDRRAGANDGGRMNCPCKDAVMLARPIKQRCSRLIVSDRRHYLRVRPIIAQPVAWSDDPHAEQLGIRRSGVVVHHYERHGGIRGPDGLDHHFGMAPCSKYNDLHLEPPAAALPDAD